MFFFWSSFFCWSYSIILVGIWDCCFSNYSYFFSSEISRFDCLSTSFLSRRFLFYSSSRRSIICLFYYLSFLSISYLSFLKNSSYCFFLVSYFYCSCFFFSSILIFWRWSCLISDWACFFASISSEICTFLRNMLLSRC